MYCDEKVTVNIRDVNISLKWRKRLQKISEYANKTVWKCGSINDEEVSYSERQVLDQDLRVDFGNYFVQIFCGHKINRDDLAFLDKLMGEKADISVTQKGNIELCYHINQTKSDYEIMPKFNRKEDVCNPIDDRRCIVHTR